VTTLRNFLDIIRYLEFFCNLWDTTTLIKAITDFRYIVINADTLLLRCCY